MNPRLPMDWLRYLVTVGGREDEDGWRWKIDPGLRMGGFGPVAPEWSLIRLPGLRMPFLGILAAQPEVMGWGTQPEDLEPWLPDGAEFELVGGLGPLRPHRVPRAGRRARPRLPGADTRDHDPPRPRPRPAGAPRAAGRRRPDRCCCSTPLADRTPAEVPEDAAAWPGPVHGLDFTGHGGSTVPAGGGYTAEILMADADAALAHLGPCTVLGRGLGAYIALMIAGARPDLVRGAVLDDGAGLAGGGDSPGSVYVAAAARPRRHRARPVGADRASPVTSAPPTTPPPSSAWRSSSPASRARSRQRQVPPARGSTPSPPNPASPTSPVARGPRGLRPGLTGETEPRRRRGVGYGPHRRGHGVGFMRQPATSGVVDRRQKLVDSRSEISATRGPPPLWWIVARNSSTPVQTAPDLPHRSRRLARRTDGRAPTRPGRRASSAQE